MRLEGGASWELRGSWRMREGCKEEDRLPRAQPGATL